jgi:hypothetical protein
MTSSSQQPDESTGGVGAESISTLIPLLLSPSLSIRHQALTKLHQIINDTIITDTTLSQLNPHLGQLFSTLSNSFTKLTTSSPAYLRYTSLVLELLAMVIKALKKEISKEHVESLVPLLVNWIYPKVNVSTLSISGSAGPMGAFNFATSPVKKKEVKKKEVDDLDEVEFDVRYTTSRIRAEALACLRLIALVPFISILCATGERYSCL